MRAAIVLLAGLVFATISAANQLTAGWQALADYHAKQALAVFDSHLSTF